MLGHEFTSGPSTRSSRSISQRSTLGGHLRSTLAALEMTSYQTLCQMPEVRGYQMECRFYCHSCLPRGLAKARGSSSARITTIARLPCASKRVMSTNRMRSHFDGGDGRSGECLDVRASHAFQKPWGIVREGSRR